MQGFFILTFAWAGKPPVVVSPNRVFKEEERPSLNFISGSFTITHKADRIVFVGDDGSIWLMKDRYETGRFPKKLRGSLADKKREFKGLFSPHHPLGDIANELLGVRK